MPQAARQACIAGEAARSRMRRKDDELGFRELCRKALPEQAPWLLAGSEKEENEKSTDKRRPKPESGDPPGRTAKCIPRYQRERHVHPAHDSRQQYRLAQAE